MSNENFIHPASEARDRAVQFLYQSECERIFHFSAGHFGHFIENFKITGKAAHLTRTIVEGTFAELPTIDETIRAASQNWGLERMASTDRCVLRIATWELMHHTTPPKVVINEAIELAKKYGTENSGSFVNGLLDQIASKIDESKTNS